MLDLRRALLGTALLALLALPGAGADHLPAYEYRPCVTTDGVDLEADCHVGGRYRTTLPGTMALPPFAFEAEIDAADPLPGASPVALPGLAFPEVAAATGPWTDPTFDQAAAAETAWKRGAFDGVESTGFHARLLCGWDLPETASVCARHNPEDDATWTPVRRERDALLVRGFAAWFDSGFARAQDLAPSADVRVATGPVSFRVEDERAALAHAPGTPSASESWSLPALLNAAPPLPGQGEPPGGAPALAARVPPTPAEGEAPAARVDPEAGTSEIQGVAAPAKARAPPGEVVAAALGAGLALLAAALALAHRHVSRANVLTNAVRARILETLRASPGATIQELATATGVSHTTATYHLSLLQEVGLAISESIGNRKHYFTNGAVANRDLRLRLLVGRMGRAREVLNLVEGGPARLADVAAGLGMSLPGALWHLRRLMDLGLVRREGDLYRPGTSDGSQS